LSIQGTDNVADGGFQEGFVQGLAQVALISQEVLRKHTMASGGCSSGIRREGLLTFDIGSYHEFGSH
jgi:hypothetical protein